MLLVLCLRTMFENQCAFKNNVYVPDLFFGTAFVATNVINHNYYPGAFSLNLLKSNVDTINTNVNTLTTNVNTLTAFVNATPNTFNLYIENMDILGNIYISGSDRSGNFGYATAKRTIYLNDGDTIIIHLLQPAVDATLLLTDLAIMLATNQQYNSVFVYEVYDGYRRRTSPFVYTLNSTDYLQIKSEA